MNQILKNIINKRFFRKVKSKLKLKIRNGAILHNEIAKKYHLVKYKHSHPKLRQVHDAITIELPRIFCLINDHPNTIKFLNDVDEILTTKEPKNLVFNHRNTQYIELAASFLFDTRIKKYCQKWRNRQIKIGLSGLFSLERDVNNFLVSFGLLDELQVKDKFHPYSVDPDYKSKYLTFKFRGSEKRAYEKGNASVQLADYFQKCFRHNKFTIQEEAKNNISNAVSEIIGNAEEHSGLKNTEWNVLGFYDKTNSVCSFAILNRGLSIYESLSDRSSTSKEVISKIEKVVNSNLSIMERTKKLTSKATSECIWNVMALQDGISSKRPDKGKGSSRGQGLLTVLHFIDVIRAQDDVTQIAVISGHSKILIDYKYPITSTLVNGQKFRQIIFNKENDLYKPQDANKVILMEDDFKGTIITGRFVINKKYLKERLAKKSNEI
ncbi:MAG: hypothetical protein HUU44_12015 [Ignavibacteriaceae bacterium]|jgi:hypothetical protein|nr:hypothetical protein [Ignavibacteriaceae bacterium]